MVILAMDTSIQPAPHYTQTMCHIISSIGPSDLVPAPERAVELQEYLTSFAIHGVLSSKSAAEFPTYGIGVLKIEDVWIQCGQGLHGQQTKYLVAEDSM